MNSNGSKMRYIEFLYILGIVDRVLTKSSLICKFIYMDIFDLESIHEEDEDIGSGIIEVPEEDIVIEKEEKKEEKKELVSNDKQIELLNDAVKNEERIRRMELATWAESKGILKGVPKIDDLELVWAALKAGKPLKKAIERVCSYSTWVKWRREYPEIAAMEEECRFQRCARLEEEMQQIADQTDRTRMGEVSRDRLMIDARMKELDRLDKLTESRMNKEPSTMVPIQINVAYGKE